MWRLRRSGCIIAVIMMIIISEEVCVAASSVVDSLSFSRGKFG